jgi:MFS family permease
MWPVIEAGLILQPSSRAGRQWPAAIRALESRDFQVYFAGQAISTLGKWIQQVALSWLAYRLTASASLLGLLTFLTLAPQLIVGPIAGAWIDKHDKRRLLLIAQALLAILSLALALMAWKNWMDDQSLIAVALALGVLNAFETPLRQALIASFVARPDDLPNALALNAMLINAARFIGPPLAGGLIVWVGEGACFLLTAAAFTLLLYALVKIKGSPTVRVSGKTGQIFQEGIRYLWSTISVRRLILGVIMVNLLASIYAVLLPVIARETYGGDARTLGLLWGAAGAGAFVATLCLAFAGQINRLGGFIFAATACCAIGLIGMAFDISIIWAAASLAVLGYGITASNVSTNMLLQRGAPSELRGRVVAFYICMRFGFEAVGGLLAGIAAAKWGTPATVCVAGVLLTSYLIADRIHGKGRDI